MYSKEKFVKIVQNLKENFYCLGNEEEKEIVEFICDNSDAIVLPKIDLNTLKALISRVDLVVEMIQDPRIWLGL